jgi:hypothetical protein
VCKTQVDRLLTTFVTALPRLTIQGNFPIVASEEKETLYDTTGSPAPPRSTAFGDRRECPPTERNDLCLQAVDLHNRDWPSHHDYQPEHEVRLRRYVMEDRLRRLAQAIKVARERAESLINRSARLHQRSEEINASYQEWRHEHAA